MSAPGGQNKGLRRVFLAPGENRLRSGFRLLGQMFLLGLFLSLFTCILGAAIFLYGQQSERAIFMLSQSVALPAVTLSVYLARRWLDRRTFASLGLHLNHRALWDMLAGFGIAGGMMALIFLIEWAAGWLSLGSPPGGSITSMGAAGGILGMLVLFLSVGWYEELLDRGYWLQNLEEGLNLFWAVLLSSCFFALAHLANPNVSVASMVGLILAGIFLAYGYTRSRQLWLPIGLHTGWNFFEGVVFGFPVSGMADFPKLLSPTVNGPTLFTGGAFGPEAGLVVLPALLLGSLLVTLYTRRKKLPNNISGELD